MTIVRAHWGQHDDSCFACKLPTLSMNNGLPKTHQHKGDPWDGNPVLERVRELQANGAKMALLESTTGPKEPSTKGDE